MELVAIQTMSRMLDNLGARMSELEKEVEDLNKAVIRLEKELGDEDPYP